MSSLGASRDATEEGPPGATAPRETPPPGRSRSAARIGATAALIAAAAAIVVIVFGGGSSYVVHAQFQDASGLVTGDDVLIGPAPVGTITGIGLSPQGQAVVTMSLHGTGTLHRGTVARIAEDSLSGIASKYIELEPGSVRAPAIRSGGSIGAGHSYAEVNIDELFNSFNAATRRGLSNLIRGEATSLKGRGALANRTLEYLAPGLQSAAQVTHELARSEPAFDGLLVQGADAMRMLASRSAQLSSLIANTSTATGAIARESSALQRALSLLPSTLRRSQHTFVGLDTTLTALDPVVSAAKPASRHLAAFASGLRSLSQVATPTIGALDTLIANPAHTGDLTSLALAAPGLLRQADRAFPALIHNFAESHNQLIYLRHYTPDVVAALADIGQASSYYDADGHYVRTEPMLYPFTTNSMGQLVMQNPAARYNGLTRLTNRCPGSAVQPSPDGSAPVNTGHCDPSQVPPGG
ncbi:MAG TPA: MlaD family protein [Solirubrobacteraceae bacterium]|nr:MlaD family protein [Solirubrobacteraceae bacterium]